jgi:chaperonin GroES
VSTRGDLPHGPAVARSIIQEFIAMSKFRPLYDRVLVKRLTAEDKTTGGLFLPETAKEKPQQAEVIAAGSGRLTKNNEIRPLTVKSGDIVLFGKYAGDEVKIDGEEHIILREEDILAIIEK